MPRAPFTPGPWRTYSTRRGRRRRINADLLAALAAVVSAADAHPDTFSRSEIGSGLKQAIFNARKVLTYSDLNVEA